LLQQIIRTGYDEQAYNLAMTSAKDGGARLKILRKNMKPEEWDIVAGSVLGKIGMATPGAQDATGTMFSPSTFLTGWSKISPEAKQALWGGTRYANLKPELDRLVRITASQKDVQRIANTSKTGTFGATFSTIFGSIASGVAGGPATGLGVAGAQVGGQYALAKLMTNKNFINWLADGAQMAKVSPGSLKSHMARLAVLASSDDEIKEEVQQLMGQLK
jgi:hypothetical protein